MQTVEHTAEGVAYPVVADPSYNYFGGANAAEIQWCLPPPRWSLCLSAQTHAEHALAATTARFDEQGHNDDADAFRHCYWFARMTIDFGASHAKGFGDRHEDYTGNPSGEKEMDLNNNAHGRTAGGQVDPYVDASSLCYEWSQDDTLQTSLE